MGLLKSSSTTTLHGNKTHALSAAPLFEIRLNSLERDVLVLKGSPLEAPSALLSGKIVLALNEPLTIKKLSLKLFGDLRVNWMEHFDTGISTYTKPVRFLKRMYEHDWDNFEIQSYTLDNNSNLMKNKHKGNSSSSSSIALSSMLTASTASSRPNLTRASKSSTSLLMLGKKYSDSENNSHKDDSAHHNSFVLGRGNYEFPFSLILPGSLYESVEGLPGGSLFYKLEATIDRGKFAKRKVCSKHLRVVRTLSADATELQESMAIDNSWPKKIDYTISIPSRAIAVGSAIPVNFFMVPLLKGLKLGKITIKLLEYYAFAGTNATGSNHTHQNDRTIHELVVDPPPDRIYDTMENYSLLTDSPSDNCLNPVNNYMKLLYDQWDVEKSFQVPPSLSQCTQDVTLETYLKVRHKLSITVALKNPNGHTSELRATLPVILYISPYVTVSAKYDESSFVYGFSDSMPQATKDSVNSKALSNVEKKSNPPSNKSSAVDLKAINDDIAVREGDNEVVFAGIDTSNTMIDDTTGRPDLMAPPNYGDHIYDTLWNDIEIPGSPINYTPARTPIEVRTPNNAPRSPGIITPTNPGPSTSASGTMRLFNLQLTKHLNDLQLQRLAEENEEEEDEQEDKQKDEASTQQESITVPVISNKESSIPEDYFSIPVASTQKHGSSTTANTPFLPHAVHISRNNSSMNLLNQYSATHTPEKWNDGALSKVPSYETALKSLNENYIQLMAPVYVDNADSKLKIDANIGEPLQPVATQGPTKKEKEHFSKGLSSSSSSLSGLAFIHGPHSTASSDSGSVSLAAINGTSSSPTNNTLSKSTLTKRNSSFLSMRFGGSSSNHSGLFSHNNGVHVSENSKAIFTMANDDDDSITSSKKPKGKGKGKSKFIL